MRLEQRNPNPVPVGTPSSTVASPRSPRPSHGQVNPVSEAHAGDQPSNPEDIQCAMASSRTNRPPLNPVRATEKLDSNIMNYLVWRYLQEMGYFTAATWLCRDWHMLPDEVMPFAKHVKPCQLIRMCQDACFMDDLQSNGDRTKHKFFFGDDHGPLASEPMYDIAGLRRQGDASSRRDEQNGTNGAVEGIMQQAEAPHSNNIQTPVNGDNMDTDENGYGASEQQSEADSPAPAVQPALPLLDTLSIGESKEVSTEKPRDLYNETTFLALPENPEVTHVEFSRSYPGPLLLGGSDLLRVYNITSSRAGTSRTHGLVDIEIPADSYKIHSVCWLNEGDVAVSAVKTRGDSDEYQHGQLMHLSDWGSGPVRVLSSLTGTVFALRFNSTSNLLLVLSSGECSVVSVYKVSPDSTDLLCVKELKDSPPLYDAVWMKDNKFIACGQNILQLFDIQQDEISITQTTPFRGKVWAQIKYDPVCDIALVMDEECQLLKQYNLITDDTKTQAFLDTKISGFELQPIPNRESYTPGTPRLLATSTIDGAVQLWDVLGPFRIVRNLRLQDQDLTHPTPFLAHALAFSPDGYLLAAAGFDTVAIWKPDDGGEAKAVWRCTDENYWRSQPADEDDGWVHNLTWDKHGKMVAFALKEQVAIIRFS